jgi:DNA-binding NtrC family response regulator
MAVSSLPEQIGYETAGYRLIGSSPAMQRIAQLVQQIGPTDAPVLIAGACGTGKGLVARPPLQQPAARPAAGHGPLRRHGGAPAGE